MAERFGRTVVRSSVVTLCSQGYKFVLTLTTLAVLARLLAPSDFGRFALVMVVGGLALVVRDLGINETVNSHPELVGDRLAGLFWVGFAVSLLLAATMAAGAVAFSAATGETELSGLAIGVALAILIGGIGVVPAAVMRRAMRFRAIAVVEVVAVTSSCVVAILSAKAGAGAWALVLQMGAYALVSSVLATAMCGWLPARSFAAVGWALGDVVHASHIALANVFNYVARSADNAFVYAAAGASALGQYSRAYQLLTAPLSQFYVPLTSVAISSLSQLDGDDDRYGRGYDSFVRVTSSVICPLVAILLVCADLVVPLVLGPGWYDAVGIFIALGVSAMIQPISTTMGWLLVTQRRASQMARIAGISTACAIVSYAVGSAWGALGVAACYSAGDLLVRAPVTFYLVGRDGPVSTWRIWARLLGAWGIAALVVVPVLGCRILVSSDASTELLASCLVFVGAWIVVIRCVPSTRASWGYAIAALRTGGRR